MGRLMVLCILGIVAGGFLTYAFFDNPEMFWRNYLDWQAFGRNAWKWMTNLHDLMTSDEDNTANGQTSTTTGSGGVTASVNLAVYADPAQTQPIDFIDWGAAHVNQTIYRTVYVVNTGTVPLTLGFWTSNYHPTNAQQIVFGVDGYTGTPLPPNGVQQLQLKMKLPAYANFTAFTFDVNIQGQEGV